MHSDTDDDIDREWSDSQHEVIEYSTESEYTNKFQTMLSKRQKRKLDDDNNSDISELETKFIAVLSSVDPRTTLKSIPAIALAKEIQKNVGDIDSLKKLERGDIVLRCKSRSQLQRALGLTRLCGKNIKTHVPKSLRECKGVIYNVDMELSDQDIVSELKKFKVTEAKRLLRGKEKETTTSVLLTFCSQTLPERVTMLYQSFKVRLYVPPALRCYKCQRFGHTATNCNSSSQICPRCSGSHSYQDCPDKDQLKCSNCGGNHSAAYKGCPKYKQAVEVQRVRVENKISYKEAVHIVKENVQSYASVVEKSSKQTRNLSQSSTAQQSQEPTNPPTQKSTCNCKCTCNNQSQAQPNPTASTSSVASTSQNVGISSENLVSFLLEVLTVCFSSPDRENQISKIMEAAKSHLNVPEERFKKFSTLNS